MSNSSELFQDANIIIQESIHDVLPDIALIKKLSEIHISEPNITLIAVGKAAWQMAYVAKKQFGNRISKGIVITKHSYSNGAIDSLEIIESGHPVPDIFSQTAAQKALRLVDNLTNNDAVLFLLSGGGSSLFELPLIPMDEMISITNQFLASGASITEINTIRKRLSQVKGGKFALACTPAHVYNIILSDIIDDPLDMIASGPTVNDTSTNEDALNILNKYNITLSEEAAKFLHIETPKCLNNVSSYIIGSVRYLCKAAEKSCQKLGYSPIILTSCLSCHAMDAGIFLANIAKDHQYTDKSIAFIAGGETTVCVKGTGLGGRNQELALSAASYLSSCKNTAIFSVGSDGTDGPTDAAGGYVDCDTAKTLSQKGFDIESILSNNDSYHGLEACNGLIKTGATGTNVNDLSVILIKR